MKRDGTQLDRVGWVAQIGDIVTTSLRKQIQPKELARLRDRQRPWSGDTETKHLTPDLNNLLKVLEDKPSCRELREPARKLRQIRNGASHQEIVTIRLYQDALDAAQTICRRFEDTKALNALATVEKALPAEDALVIIDRQGKLLELAGKQEARLMQQIAERDRAQDAKIASAHESNSVLREIDALMEQAADTAVRTLTSMLSALGLISTKRDPSQGSRSRSAEA